MAKSDKAAPAAAPAPVAAPAAPAREPDGPLPQDPLAGEAAALADLNGGLVEAMKEWGKFGPGEVGSALFDRAAEPPAPAAPAPEATPAPTAAAPAAPAPTTPVAAPPAAPAPAAPLPGAPPAIDVNELVRANAAVQREIEEAKAEARRQAAAAKAVKDELDAMRARIAADPLAVVKAEGWDMESLNRAVMEGQTPAGVRVSRLERELAELKASEGRRIQEEANRREMAEAARAIESFKDALATQFAGVATNFPYTQAFLEQGELREALYSVVTSEYQNSGGTKRLTAAQAAEKLEQQLTARATKLKAIQPTPSPAPAPTPAPTLTNSNTPQTPNPELDPLDDLTLSPTQLARAGEALLRKANAQAQA